MYLLPEAEKSREEKMMWKGRSTPPLWIYFEIIKLRFSMPFGIPAAPVVASLWHACHSQLLITIESSKRFVITGIDLLKTFTVGLSIWIYCCQVALIWMCYVSSQRLEPPVVHPWLSHRAAWDRPIRSHSHGCTTGGTRQQERVKEWVALLCAPVL